MTNNVVDTGASSITEVSHFSSPLVQDFKYYQKKRQQHVDRRVRLIEKLEKSLQSLEAAAESFRQLLTDLKSDESLTKEEKVDVELYLDRPEKSSPEKFRSLLFKAGGPLNEVEKADVECYFQFHEQSPASIKEHLEKLDGVDAAITQIDGWINGIRVGLLNQGINPDSIVVASPQP